MTSIGSYPFRSRNLRCGSTIGDRNAVDEVVGLLAEHGDDAKLLAGGQSLVPMMAMRLVRASHVIDLNRVAALAG